MDIAYLAQTAWSTLLLDGEGVCVEARTRQGKKATSDGAAKCIGAQYVASLDTSAAGMFIEMPRIGCPMVFAATTADGRIYLVRTGPVVHFEEVSSGVHERDALVVQERARANERVVLRERVADDEEMTTPFRRDREKRAKSSRRDSRESHASLPPPAPVRRRMPLPPPPAGSPGGYESPSFVGARPQTAPSPRHSSVFESPVPAPMPAPMPSAPTARRSIPPPPSSRLLHESVTEEVEAAEPIPPRREVMWSLPESDLKSDRSQSPVAAYPPKRYPPTPRSADPAPWQIERSAGTRSSRRR